MKFCDHVWVWEESFLSDARNLHIFSPYPLTIALYLSLSFSPLLLTYLFLKLHVSCWVILPPSPTLPLPSISEWQNSLFEYLKRFSFNHSIFFTLGNSYTYYLTFVPFILYWNHILFFSAFFSILFFVDRITSIHSWIFYQIIFHFYLLAVWIASQHFINV